MAVSATKAARLALAVLAVVAGVVTGCGTGARPTLVDIPNTSADDIVYSESLDVTPAPADLAPLAPADPALPLEASVDDALTSWALANGVPYVDNCLLTTPAPGELCDRPTERDTVRLLGPSADESWYVVIIHEEFDPEAGRGYRVDAVSIAGRP